MAERWSVRVARDDCKFSCAHFLIFPDGTKERLHGHNYAATCEVGCTALDRGLVLDFNQLKPLLRGVCRELNERWLLPGEHPELRIRPRDDGHTEVAYRDCRYLAPSAEVLVLPVGNLSVEHLAAWIGRRLLDDLGPRLGGRLRDLTVTVAEMPGQTGAWTWTAG